MLYVLLCAQLPAQDLPADNIWIDLQEQVRCRAVGNGQATGQIGTLFLSNESEQAFMIQAQAFFIPSDGRHQGYLAHIPAGLTAAPQSVTSIPVIGYCTDLDKPAVPASSPLPSPNQWYVVAQEGVGTPGLKILAQDAELEAFEPTQISELEASKAFRRERSKADWQLQYPGSKEALEGNLQIEEYANISAPLLRAMLQQLEERYDLLLVDYHMPQIDGLKLLEWLENDEAHPNQDITKIMVTADPNIPQSTRGAIVKAGARIVSKGMSIEDLRMLSRLRKSITTRSRPMPPPACGLAPYEKDVT